VAALIHQNTGRKPAHAIGESLVSQIVSFKQSALYCDANFRHFRELLERLENISISYSSLYTLLSKAGLKSPKKRRRIKLHWRRKRKEQPLMITPFSMI
jgi:transposase